MSYFELMKKILLYIFCSVLIPVAAHAQFESYKDSVVQLYGVVMSADSLQALPAVSVVVQGTNRGTITSNEGVFSIVVLKGDQVEFSSIGYKPVTITVPRDLKSNQYSVAQLMVQNAIYLPATIIPANPTPAQLFRDIANADIPDDEKELARKNLSDAKLRALMAVYPVDGQEASGYYLKQNARKYYSAGQMPPQNIFNPMAWAEFIKAWKRGDFRRK